MTTTTRVAAAAATTLLGLAALTACGSSSDSSPSDASSTSSSAAPSSSSAAAPSSSSAEPASIMIMDYKYSGTTKIAPGAKVMVMNHDSEAHTVTADKGSAFDVTIPPGKTATLTAPSKPGSYAYHCTYHSNMHSTLTVG
jgi:plastocyanin